MKEKRIQQRVKWWLLCPSNLLLGLCDFTAHCLYYWGGRTAGCPMLSAKGGILLLLDYNFLHSYSGGVQEQWKHAGSVITWPTSHYNFIYKWRGTYYSFSYNLALGISKILTLRLALRLFGKSSNNGSAVYIVLAIWDRMNCYTSTTWRGSRGKGECVLLRPFQYGLHTDRNEWTNTLTRVNIHPI